MRESILVTGGAGFIGSQLVPRLLEHGYKVKIIDALLPQVHGEIIGRPKTVPEDVRFVCADLNDKEKLNQVLEDVDVVIHLAADVGVGQSMYEIVRYARNNTLATASLLETMLSHRHHIKKLMVASSMAIYGEGAYECHKCGKFYPKSRTLEQLQQHDWEMHCPICGGIANRAPTSEEKPPYPNSIYAITKRDQEEMCLAFGQAYSIPTVALRFFNVYGPGQHLSNPYTGVTAIFSSRLINGMRPVIFEDGLQTRDFVHITDIIGVILSVVRSQSLKSDVYNVGSGRPITVLEVAHLLAQELGTSTETQISKQFRKIDIRHCYANISKTTQELGYTPQIRFEDGIKDFVSWALTNHAVDRVDQAVSELVEKGLIQ